MKTSRFEAELKSWMTNNNLDEFEFISQDGTDLSAVWSSRQVPKDMRTFTDAQHYLEIQMDITDPSMVAVDATFPSEDVDEDLLLDSAVVMEGPSGQHMQRYRAFIDVLLHPMYEVPCPFIRMYDCRGQLLPTITTQSLVSRVFHSPTIGGTDAKKDTKEENHIQFTFEEHPYLTIPCLCLHVCGVRECMAMLDLSRPQERKFAPSAVRDMTGITDNNHSSSSSSSSSSDSSSNTDGDNSNNTDDSASSDMYLLRWFSLVGPAIGLHISPQLFAKLSSLSSPYE